MNLRTHFCFIAQVRYLSPSEQRCAEAALAGKDRTGVLALLILSVAGADTHTINHDYALTRVGTEPVREFLLLKLGNGKPVDVNDPVIRAYAGIP